MIYTEDNMNEKPLFVIEERPDVVEGQADGETPVITIETHNTILKPKRRTPWVIGTAIVTLLLCAAAFLAYRYHRTYVDIGVPTAVTSAQNIEKLQKPIVNKHAEVILTSDSILGVALNFYELRGLKAEISFTEPGTKDAGVFFYSRCADHTSYDPKSNRYLGTLVVNGKEMESDVCRLGYCAMADGNVVIGIARDEDVKDYVVERGGSFFRQFVLVSNGELPSRFHLHGKVERRGLGRIGDKLYYIETLHKETMWDFADALREYGFIDAIYITGGNDHSFYRSADGTAHPIGDGTRYKHKHKGAGLIPWLVFRKM